MKRVLLPIALVLGLLAGMGSAVAAPPIPVDPTTETLDCPGFQVEAVTTGKAKVIDMFPNRNLNFEKPVRFYTNVGAAVTVTLTGPAPASKVLTYPLNGTVRLAFDFNIPDFLVRFTGKNLVTVPTAYGIPGIFYTSGQLGYAEGGPVYPNAGLTGPGKITDVCALLAP